MEYIGLGMAETPDKGQIFVRLSVPPLENDEIPRYGQTTLFWIAWCCLIRDILAIYDFKNYYFTSNRGAVLQNFIQYLIV